jgi:hypothetical protein
MPYSASRNGQCLTYATLALLTGITPGSEDTAVFLYDALVETVSTDRTAAVRGGGVGTQLRAGSLQTLDTTLLQSTKSNH